MSKVTIVVPVYNAEIYLSKCIKSLTNQTYTNIEIILINDGSTDRSREFCEKEALNDKRIKVIHIKNQGVSNARNIGIDLASGEFICFVDSDDYIDKNMIEDLHKKIITDSADIVICGHRSIYSKEAAEIEHSPLFFSGKIQDFLNEIESFINTESVQGPCGKLYRLSIIKRNNIVFPKNMSFGEDTIFVYKYLAKSTRASTTSNCYYNYNRINENSLSTVFREDKIYIYLKLYAELERILKDFNINKKDMIERKICDAAIYCIGELYNIENKKSKKLRIKYIDTLLSNEKIFNSFLSRRKDNIRLLMLYFFVKKKQIRLIDILFYLKKRV